MPKLRAQIPKDPSTAPVATKNPPNPLILAHKHAALYRLCGGKFQCWNSALLSADKDDGLTWGSLSRQRAEYYYKGYPNNGVTAKVADQQLGLDEEEPGLVEEPTLVVSTGMVWKTVSTKGKHTIPVAAAGAKYRQAWMMAGPYCRESTVRKAQKRKYDKLGYTISCASVSAAGKAIDEEGVQIEPLGKGRIPL